MPQNLFVLRRPFFSTFVLVLFRILHVSYQFCIVYWPIRTSALAMNFAKLFSRGIGIHSGANVSVHPAFTILRLNT